MVVEAESSPSLCPFPALPLLEAMVRTDLTRLPMILAFTWPRLGGWWPFFPLWVSEPSYAIATTESLN